MNHFHPFSIAMLNDQRVCTFNTWNSLPYMVIYKISIRPYKLCTCRCTMRDKYMVTQKKRKNSLHYFIRILPSYIFVHSHSDPRLQWYSLCSLLFDVTI